ncbi:FAD-dependent oxidoreductase [Thalassomonas sp. RHCl1]|uniref:FAD-dependent oxidoreductase n=1 Tax=Thalassomonas sp. RHCl1 TaxID=2995320 RepID=UPI00248AAD12|nr:FAD-dependent oxidoreductase [Thalassomonas sp. RHCl1]
MREFTQRAKSQQSSYPVVVVGAGPIGLALAVDLAQRDINVVLIDQKTKVGRGSRAVTFSKRSLEIFDKLGVGDQITEHGTQWSISRTYFGGEMIDAKNLQPEQGLKRPAYVNLQQYHVEDYLVKRAQQLPCLDIRWGTKLLSHQQDEQGVTLNLEDPEGEYQLNAQYMVAADGAHSPIRKAMNLDFDGREFKDRFLIVDAVMEADYAPERHFWFSPSFHEGHSVLLHKQPDNIWRIDFQLGWDSDPEVEVEEERVKQRLYKMLGDDAKFELKWVSVYTFECRQMSKFKHGRTLFIGDAAHRVSPFGARGANSGFQDTDNLSWKLARVINGQATDALLESYSEERHTGAMKNLQESSRSTDFITPKSKQSFRFRDAVLTLAKTHHSAKQMINSGRLSTATDHLNSSLNGDSDTMTGGILPGQVALDAAITTATGPAWLLEQLAGNFALIHFGEPSEQQLKDFDLLTEIDQSLRLLIVSKQKQQSGDKRIQHLLDQDGFMAQRYLGNESSEQGTTYLIRPDDFIAGRWLSWDKEKIQSTFAGCLK